MIPTLMLLYRHLRAPLFALTFGLGLAACGAGAQQRLPVGSPCGAQSECGSDPFACLSGDPYWAGYCTRPCATDGDCPLDSLCGTKSRQCRRACTRDADCRVDDGYRCLAAAGTGRVCDVAGH